MHLGRLTPSLAGALALAACSANPPPQSPATQTVVVVPPPAPPPAPAPVAPSYVSEADGVIPILPTDPTWGSRTAPVTIVYFGDFQCPFTARSVPTILALEEKFGQANLRVVWKNQPLPFHPNARPAAEAAEAVQILGGSDAFWKFFASAFQNQSQLGPDAYETWAQGAGVNVSTFRELVQAHAGGAKVEADEALAKKIGARGTPSFFINGVRVNGAQPEEKFVAVIDAEIAKAAARLAQGTAAELVYLAMVKENYVPAPEPETTTAAAETPEQWKVSIDGSPVRGSDAALVTIVELGDYQCPFCRRAQPTLQKIRDTYGDKVRFAWRDNPMPFHPHAMPAAEVAREARAEKGVAGFWAVHDALFAHEGTLDDAALDGIAAAAHLDAARVRGAIAGERYKAAIRKDADRAQGLDSPGTPTFFINGWKLVGAQPFEKFQALIDKEIARAEALVAKGTPRSALYDALIRDGRVPGAGPRPAPAAAPTAAPTPPPPTTSPSVVVSDLVVGTGPMVKDGDRVTVHYVGTLDDGTEFDSSRSRGSPITVGIGMGQVIKGWDQGVPGMRVGGKRRLVIPAALAYGSRSMPRIPANSNLTFEIELISIR